MKPDVLAGLSRRQRFKREASDLDLLSRLRETKVSTQAQAEMFRRLGYTSIAPLMPGDKPQGMVCERIDLDHPMLLPDNQIDRCADCDCDIQHRPILRADLLKLCICCAARRVRKERKSLK